MILVDNIVWDAGLYRVFVSYSSVQQELATDLKNELRKYSISAFVAADNIHAGGDWRQWIEHALNTTNYVVALVTCDFNKSVWTNQEMGFAYARRIPTLSIKYGAVPGGFAEKFQTIDCTDQDASQIAFRIYNSLLHSHVFFGDTWNILVNSYAQNPNEIHANHIVHVLSQVKLFSPEQEQKLLSAINSSQQVYNSEDFLSAVTYRLGLLTGNQYALYEPTPRHHQLIRIDPNSPIYGYTGEYCTIPGTYRSQCRPDFLTSMKAGDRFPLCGVPNQHYYHAAYWFLHRSF